MAYPSSLDELTDGVPSDGAAPTTALDNATYPHDDHHRALGVAVEAIEAELGTNPKGGSADVKTRIAATETVANAAAAKASNLSDLTSASSARTNLGLGGAAVLNVGTSAGTVAAGDDSRFSAGGAPPLSSPASGFWWTTPGYPDTVAVALNTAFAVPFVCPRAMTITRIGAEPSSAATAGSLVRLGIYTDSSGLPGTVLLDAGTILGTSATFQEITISQALSANTKYWFVMAAQGGGNVTMRASRGGFSIPQAYTTSGNEAGAIRQVGSTWSGALISPFPTVDDFRPAAPRFTIKVA